MKKLNDLMLKLMLDKRFSHLRLEHYDAFLESSLNNVAKEHLLSAVHDIIRNGLINRHSYDIELHFDEGFDEDCCCYCIKIRYSGKYGNNERYRIEFNCTSSNVVRVIDFAFSNGIVAIYNLSEDDVLCKNVSEEEACIIVESFWNDGIERCSLKPRKESR